mgnify:CR=1 FL=1
MGPRQFYTLSHFQVSKCYHPHSQPVARVGIMDRVGIRDRVSCDVRIKSVGIKSVGIKSVGIKSVGIRVMGLECKKV